LGAARGMVFGGGIRSGEGQKAAVTLETTVKATAQFWWGKGWGRKADFSAALLVTREQLRSK
jgi:hypothetical protein